MNLPNAITIGRMVLVPVFAFFMYRDGRVETGAINRPGTWVAFGVFAVAALSDSLDGYLARKNGTITRLGKFLDPLADKLLVGAALVTLVAFRGFPLWAALVIAIREVAVSLLRTAGLRRGKDMPASVPGKIKTAIQVPMVLLWLMPRRGGILIAQDVAVWLAAAFTIWSGLQYLLKAGELLRDDEAGKVG